MIFYPLKFNPIFKQRIWGGTRLTSVLNKPSFSEKIVTFSLSRCSRIKEPATHMWLGREMNKSVNKNNFMLIVLLLLCIVLIQIIDLKQCV